VANKKNRVSCRSIRRVRSRPRRPLLEWVEPGSFVVCILPASSRVFLFVSQHARMSFNVSLRNNTLILSFRMRLSSFAEDVRV